MRLVKQLLSLLLILWAAVILLAPKSALYHWMEHRLQPEGIILDHEAFHATPIGFGLSDARLLIHGVPVGTFPHIRLRSFLIYSELTTGKLIPDASLRRRFPVRLDRARAVYVLWHPRTILLTLSGSFGTFRGQVDLKNRHIRLRLEKVGKIDPIRAYLRRDKKGWYYERSF